MLSSKLIRLRAFIELIVLVGLVIVTVLAINGLGRANDKLGVHNGDKIHDVERKLGPPDKTFIYEKDRPIIDLYIGDGAMKNTAVARELWYRTQYIGSVLIWTIKFDSNNRVIAVNNLQ